MTENNNFPGVLRSRVAARMLWAGLLLPAGLILIGAPDARAMGLGQMQLHSALGQALRLQIPVLVGAGEEVGCVEVKGTGDDMPTPARPHFQVISTGGNTYIEITTSQAVNDPAIGVLVTAGCASPISRSYVIFLDPPVNVTVSGVSSFNTANSDLPASSELPLPANPVSPPVSRRGVPRISADRSAAASSTAAGGASRAPVPSAQQKPVLAPILAPKKLSRAALARLKKSGKTPEPLQADRIRLSNDIDSPPLRIASDLGVPDSNVPMDSERLKALRLERARLMAILTGVDPDSVPNDRELDLQKKLADSSAEAAAMRQQIKQITERTANLERTTLPQYVTWIFSAIAALAILIAGWFAFRYRKVQKAFDEHPWWEQQAQMQDEAPVADAPEYAQEDDGGELIERRSRSRPAPVAVEPEYRATPIDEGPNTVMTAALSASAAATTTAIPMKEAAAPVAPPPARVQEVISEEAALAAAKAAIASRGRTSGPASSANVASESEIIAGRRAGGSPGAPAPYIVAKSTSGSLDERVDIEIPEGPSTLDFNLDIPDITTNLGKDDKGVAGSDTAQTIHLTPMQPLEFKLDTAPSIPDAPVAAPSASDPPAMGPDTILRLDDPNMNVTQPGKPGGGAEQASTQFRLIQFASVLEQADDLTRVGEPAKAIALLRQYVLRDETIPTVMWLLLFDLYRQVNKKPVYEALSEHFSRRYKRPMVKWDETLDSRAAQVPLSDLPQLDAQIKAEWGSQDGVELLRSLVCDRTQGDDIIFNARLQRDLLQMAKVFPLDDSI